MQHGRGPATPDPRSRLLDAADALMHRRGYEAVGVAELCRHAGVQKGSFYHFFESKQALTIEMLERSWERTRSALFAAAFADRSGSVVEAFTRYGDLLAAHLERLAEADGPVVGCRFGNFACELGATNDTVRACVSRVFDEMLDIFASVIARGQLTGEVPDTTDPRETARHVLAHMEGLMLVAKATQDAHLLTGLGPAVARLLWCPPPNYTGRPDRRPRSEESR